MAWRSTVACQGRLPSQHSQPHWSKFPSACPSDVANHGGHHNNVLVQIWGLPGEKIQCKATRRPISPSGVLLEGPAAALGRLKWRASLSRCLDTGKLARRRARSEFLAYPPPPPAPPCPTPQKSGPGEWGKHFAWDQNPPPIFFLKPTNLRSPPGGLGSGFSFTTLGAFGHRGTAHKSLDGSFHPPTQTTQGRQQPSNTAK